MHAPLADLSLDRLAAVRIVAADIDGTVTRDGKFTPELLGALQRLTALQVKCLLITGRPAGWVQAISNYFPIWGAIAEGGGVFFPAGEGTVPRLLGPAKGYQMDVLRATLRDGFRRIAARHPQVRESPDNPSRWTDWTFDLTGLTRGDFASISELARECGLEFTYSTVQCHLFLSGQSKAAALQEILPDHADGEIIFIGDSPNDESLFARPDLAIGVGVSNIRDFLDQMSGRPHYLTAGAELDGFLELVCHLERARRLR